MGEVSALSQTNKTHTLAATLLGRALELVVCPLLVGVSCKTKNKTKKKKISFNSSLHLLATSLLHSLHGTASLGGISALLGIIALSLLLLL